VRGNQPSNTSEPVAGHGLTKSAQLLAVGGANAIIALHCLHISGRAEEFWEERAVNG